MAKVPVICDSCQAFFVTESLLGGDTKSVTLVRNKVGPCPQCGETGSIPDGTYEFIGSTIKLLSGTARSVSQLQHLAALLRESRARNATAAEISEKVKKELPELTKLSDLLPRTRAELYAFIAIILTVVGMLIQAANQKETTTIEINQVINNITQEITIHPVTPNPTAAPSNEPSEEAGRNPNKAKEDESCPCGSGKKYKHCHGR